MARRDIQKEITAQIVAMIKEHGQDWTKPFADLAGSPKNAKTENKYNGLNALWLGLQGHTYWATYNQWQALGAQVKKGSKATHISVPVIIKDKDDKEKIVGKYFKPAAVFSSAQVDGWAEPAIENRPDLTERLTNIDSFIDATGANITHSAQGRAYYNRLSDSIHLPNRENFSATEFSSATQTYYGTALHELIHWTGSETRLDRTKGQSFGDHDYAYEELVAEVGATLASVELGLEITVRADHAQYIANWLSALNDNKDFIFKASADAQKAFNYLQSLQTESSIKEEAA